MNVATVKLAEMVGYDNVVEMARRAGLNYNIHPTPAVALGAYEVTPLEMAGAYTVFADGGVYVKPNYVSMVPGAEREAIFTEQARTQARARSAGGLPGDQPDGGGDAHRHRRRRARAGVHSCPPPARPALRMTAGSPATPPTCSASSGWGSTTTANWISKAPIPPCRSGPNS